MTKCWLSEPEEKMEDHCPRCGDAEGKERCGVWLNGCRPYWNNTPGENDGLRVARRWALSYIRALTEARS